MTAEAVSSGDTSSTDVNMRPADVNMHAATAEAAEVTAGEVGSAKATKMASTSVTSASMTASAPAGQRRCRHYGCTQKRSHQGHHNHRFSQHRNLHRLAEALRPQYVTVFFAVDTSSARQRSPRFMFVLTSIAGTALPSRDPRQVQ
jgi:hypothetical protein